MYPWLWKNDTLLQRRREDKRNVYRRWMVENRVLISLHIVLNQGETGGRIDVPIFRDQFILLENGYGQIVGRYKEIIIRGGENIYPKEIEDFLNTHPDILESYVIGVPDKRLGEEVCAFLRTTANGKEMTKQDILDFASGKLAYFKIPKYVRHIENFPKTISGKIQKFKLAEIFTNL